MSKQILEQLLWTEKYRPRSLKDVVNQDEIVKRLQVFVKEKNMPHLLFVGPPGVGKTTVALALVQDLYGENYRRYVLETNASDERGIDVIRTKIKEFARAAVVGEIPFKVVILDEADNMCLHPKTKVLVGRLDDLEVKTLEELYREYGDRDFDIPSLNPETLSPENDKGHIVDSGEADLYEIILEDGSRVLASPEHPFFIIKNRRIEVVRVKDLRKGMEIATFKDKISRCANCGKIYYNTRNYEVPYCRVCIERKGIEKTSFNVASRISVLAIGSKKNGSKKIYHPRSTPLKTLKSPVYIKVATVFREKIYRKIRSLGVKASCHGNDSLVLYVTRGNHIYIKIKDAGDQTANILDPGIEHHRKAIYIDIHPYIERQKDIYRYIYEAIGISGQKSLDVKHVKIISIRYLGKHKVLNISMRKNKNFFLANGILTHNTSDAQQALRRLMEMYVETTRFILLANYPSKIIDPIQSRCALFRFTPLKKEDIVERLKYIAENEKVSYDIDALETIYEISEGDMRKSINILQAAAALGKVTVSTVYRVVGLAHPKEIREMIQLALNGKFVEARDKLRRIMVDYGLSGIDVIKQIHREIFSPDIKIPEDLRVYIADYTGEINYRLVEGADDEIQINALLARLVILGKKLMG